MAAVPGLGEPFPDRDVIVTPSRKAAFAFLRWIDQSLMSRVNLSPTRVQAPDTLTAVAASTSGTLGGENAGGFYRVTAYREVTTQDPVSSGLALSLNWTHNGKALSRVLAAFSGAPQTVNDSVGDVEAIQIDAGTPISYTLTYSSNTPALAQYDVTLSAELLASID